MDIKTKPTVRRCASFKALQSIKDVSPRDAHKVRKVWRKMTRDQLIAEFPNVAYYVKQCFNPPDTRILRRMAVDIVLNTCGVEYLGQSKKTGNDVYYCNAGDTYAATVIFAGPYLYVGCWGDLVENGSIHANAT